MRFRCPGCQNLFELDALPESGRTQCPTCNQPVKVGAPPAIPVPQRPIVPDPDFNAIPHTPFQPQTLPAYLTQPPPRPQRRQRNPLDDLPRESTSRSGGSVVLWILGLFIGGAFALALMGGVGFFLYKSGAFVGTSEMSIAGYSAKAKGNLAGKNSSMAPNEVGILNPQTGSQFQLIYIASSGFREVTPNVFIEGLRSTAFGVTSEPTSRLGMSGIRFTAKNAFNDADGEGEVFPISSGILIVLYQPGSSLAPMKGRSVKYTGSTEREMDKVEEFFASLSRN